MTSVPDEMRPTYLVQRLNKPLGGGQMTTAIEAFSFGGGLRDGGLKPEAMSLLRELFSFDYMGAAEFEFGAVPEALSHIAKAAGELCTFTVNVPLATVPPNWRITDDVKPEGIGVVYGICRHSQLTEVCRRIKLFAAGKGRTKERVGLDSTLRPYNEWDRDVCGWLELDNGYFFFTDVAMWAGTAKLFGLDVAAKASA
jgi:hypothetical protein